MDDKSETERSSVVIEIPESVEILVGGDPETVTLLHTGRVTAPARWTGADWQAWHDAGKPADEKEHPLQRKWRWAKERVVEWAIEGLSTNPQQIDDDKLPWPVMAFITKAMHGAMVNYIEERVTEVKATLTYPDVDGLNSGEFFAWEKAMRKASEQKELNGLLRGWPSGRVLIRQWPNGTPPEDARKVDLALLAAVEEITTETITPALNLGNLRWPPGAAST